MQKGKFLDVYSQHLKPLYHLLPVWCLICFRVSSQMKTWARRYWKFTQCNVHWYRTADFATA